MEIATWLVMTLPIIGEWGLALTATVFYFSRGRRTPERNAYLMRRLCFVSIAVLFTLALLATFLQYAVWRGDPFSQNLLPPSQSILYFAKYAGTHFWLTPLISLVVGTAFYGLLTTLKRKNDRFFEEGETELGAVALFLVGWPRVVVFLPAAFLAVVVISAFKLALKRGAYTTLGAPFLFGLAVTLAWGFALLRATGLEPLAVIPGIR